MEKEDNQYNHQDIQFFFKMSIFQFLLKNGFHFYNKENEVTFDLLTNDKKARVYNSIIVNNDNSLFLTSCLAIKKEFLNAQKLIILANYINEFMSVFNSYVREVAEEDYSLFYIKTLLRPQEGTCIDDDFWKSQLSIQINNVSIFTDFLYFRYPSSKFYKNREVDTIEFKQYFFDCVEDYVEALQVISEEENKKGIDYSSWTKEQISEEIDKELTKFSKGEKNTEKLDLLVDSLQLKEKENVNYS